MEFNTDKSLFLGIDKEGDLIVLDLNFNDLNKNTKWYNPHYYITPHGYTDIKDAKTGEEEARERLSTSEHWDEIGMLKRNAFLNDFIDFDKVADSVLNTDGWTMTNGEFYFIGNYEDKNFYINLNWMGRDKKKLFNKKDFQKLYINNEDFKFLSKVGEIKESNKKEVNEIKTIFSKYQDTQQIIKDMLEIHE